MWAPKIFAVSGILRAVHAFYSRQTRKRVEEMKATISQGLARRAFRPTPSLPSLTFAAASGVGAGILLVGAPLLLGAEVQNHALGLGLFAYLLASGLSAYAIHISYPHAKLGMCNLVTLARLVIVGVLCVAMLSGIAPNAVVLGLAVLSLSLDGVDGWFARHQGLSSDFGARFDVEVDAAFALALAVYAAKSDLAGAYVILLGLPHYLFWGARSLWPWLNAPLPPKLSRKAVCVLQIGTLIALLLPQFGDPLRNGIVAIAVLALVWSFGRDILWLYRRQT